MAAAIPNGMLLSGIRGQFRLAGENRKAAVILSPGSVSEAWLVKLKGCEADFSILQLKLQLERSGFCLLGEIEADAQALSEIYRKDKQACEGLNKSESGWSSLSSREIFEDALGQALECGACGLHIHPKGQSSQIFLQTAGGCWLYSEIEGKKGSDLAAYALSLDAGGAQPEGAGKGGLFKKRLAAAGKLTDLKVAWTSAQGQAHADVSVFISGQAGDESRSLEQMGWAACHVNEAAAALQSKRPVVICGKGLAGKSSCLSVWIRRMGAQRRGFCRVGVCGIVPGPEAGFCVACEEITPQRLRQSAFDAMTLDDIEESGRHELLSSCALDGIGCVATMRALGPKQALAKLRALGAPSDACMRMDFLHQALVPKLCGCCSVLMREKVASSELKHDHVLCFERIRLSGIFSDEDFENIKTRGPGCSKCFHTGIESMTVCCGFGSTVSKQAAREYALGYDLKGKSAYEHGLAKIWHGLVCPLDFENEFGCFGQPPIF